MLHHSLLALMLFQAALLITAVMLVAWILSLRRQNPRLGDVAWSGLFAAVTLLYAALGEASVPKKAVILFMVLIWSLRLTLLFLKRAKETASAETGSEFHLLAYFELRGALTLVLSFPFALICANAGPVFSIWEILGMGAWAIGLIGEILTDRQLRAFQRDPSRAGQVFQGGLWRYSRHPNYFFEWLVWWGYFFFAIGTPWGWVSIYCPVVVYLMLTRVTGVPIIEGRMLNSRGESYRIYQQRTNAFFPWLQKQS
jgi:steroid 5-alpha reductase family enzyme